MNVPGWRLDKVANWGEGWRVISQGMSLKAV